MRPSETLSRAAQPLSVFVNAQIAEFREGSLLMAVDALIEAALEQHQRAYAKVGKLAPDMDAGLGSLAYDLAHDVRQRLLEAAPAYARALAERDQQAAREEAEAELEDA